MSKTARARDLKFGMQLCIRNAERASERVAGHVTHTIFGNWYSWLS